jgi:hypothetical protein
MRGATQQEWEKTVRCKAEKTKNENDENEEGRKVLKKKGKREKGRGGKSEKKKKKKKKLAPSSSLGASHSRANHSSTPISKALECTP